MTTAHAARLAALGEQLRDALECVDKSLGDVGMAVGERPRQLLNDGREDVRAVASVANGAVLVVARDHVGQSLGELVGERALLLPMTEQRLLREAAHVHGPFDRLPISAKLQAPFGREHDGH